MKGVHANDAANVRFGSYRVVETIGAGAFSTLHRAVQDTSGRVVAIKALKSQIAPTSSFAQQLEREGQILGSLAHPNVVLLLDVARSSSGHPYLVLEHIDGPLLSDVLAKRGKLPVEGAIAIAHGIASALEHAHGHDVIHRDVKPSNVLLSRSGAVKLIDFGIAQRTRTSSLDESLGAEGITPSGRVVKEAANETFGTPAYMSPEQILGDFVDGRSDLFSVGIVLYQLLCGSRPFEDSRAEGGRAPRARRSAPVPLRDRAPEVPRAVERVVMRLLEASPSDRYADAATLRERLERILRSMTTESTNAIVLSVLTAAGFLKKAHKPTVAGESIAPASSIRRAFIGYAAIVGVFAIGAFAIERNTRPLRETRGSQSQALAFAPASAGGLRVVASPWARVRVDGQDVETTPFARAIPLSAGKHWVTLSHPESPSVTREIEINEGEIRTLEVTMPLFEEDAGVFSR